MLGTNMFLMVILAIFTFGTEPTRAVGQFDPFDFRDSNVPVGDDSDFYDVGDTVPLVCMFDPGTSSYTIQIRVNDEVTGEMTQLSGFMLADRTPATATASVTAQLDPSTYQCFASHNDPDGVDVEALYTTFINPFFNFTTNETVLVADGDTIDSPCIGDGNPIPTVQLFFEGSVIVPDVTPSFVQEFMFGDDGTYRCVASTPGADRDAEFTYNVIISPLGSIEIAANPLVNEDTEVTINCTSRAGPLNNFTWFDENEQEITSMGNFFIQQVSPMFSQLTVSDLISASTVMFTCRVENEAGMDNETITIEVPLQDFLDVSPLNRTVDLGTTAVFTCSNPGLESGEFFWIRNHTDPTTVPNVDLIDLSMISNPYIVVNNPVLTITDVELADAGIYACVSNNNDVTVTESVTLYIQPNVTNQLVEMFVEEGDEVEFFCMATGFPTPTYHWERFNLNNNMFEIIPGETDEQLILDPVRFNDFGRYRCVATVAVHDTFTDESNDVILHVSPTRSVVTSPMMASVDHGDTINFHCDSMGGPNNMYFWVRNASEEVCLDCAGVTGIKSFLEGIALSNDTIEILSFQRYFTIPDVNATQHGGTYFCVAINQAGYGISSSTLYVTPAFVVQPQDIKTTVDTAVAFNCEAQSFPFPSYRWERVPSMMIPGVDVPMLEFDSVEFNDFGNYICVASIDVFGVINETESDEATLFVSPLGSVDLSPSLSLLEQGDELILTCEAMGGPNNTIDFFLNGAPFTAEDDSVFSQDGFNSSRVITINSVDAAVHKGQYSCEVANMAGIDFANATVIISPFGIVNIDPMNRTSFRGDNVTFDCQTEAGPGNSYFWFFNTSDPTSLSNDELEAQAISMNRVLLLEDVNAPSNGGQYSCVAVNDAGNGTDSATLYFIPEFVVQPQDQLTTAGSTFSLTCMAEGFPDPSIQWQFMNRVSRQFEDIPGEVDNVLLFENIEHSEFGMYQCVARNSINEEVFEDISDPALVTVSPEGSIMLTPQNMTFDYQNQAVLTCTVEGGPNNVFEWFLNDSLVVSGENYTEINSSLLQSTLTISSVSAPMHGGTYRCKVTNPAGFEDAETLLFVSPRFIEQPQPQTLTANGSNAVLTCIAEAFPVPQYQWMDTLSMQIVGQPQPLLEFLPALFGDESIYQCHVSSNNLTIYSQEAQLHVSPMDGVTITPPVINGMHGNDYSTLCSSLGGLNNQFQWTYIRTNTDVSSTPKLYLNDSTVLDAGDYQCIVTNPAGNDTEIFRLNIGPRLIESPMDMNVTIREDNITLDCVFTGFPIPDITWSFNDSLVVEVDRITITTVSFDEMPNGFPAEDFGRVASTLIVLNASVNDTGSYRCDANSPGYQRVSSDDALVLVQDVPDAPHSLDAIDVMSQSLVITWTAPFDNNAPVLGYYIFYNNPSFIDGGSQVGILIDEAVEEFLVLDLHPGVSYEFTLIAFNDIGNSTDSDPFFNETLEEAPSGPPQNLQAAPISATSILVMWTLPAEIDRRGVITSYDIRHSIIHPNGTVLETILISDISSTETSLLLSGLMEFTNYSIMIRANTGVGPGPFSMQIVIVLTNETFPGPLDPPTIGAINSTTAVVTWSPPEDPNGIILGYEVEYTPVSFVGNVFGSRKRQAIMPNEDILNCLEFLTNTTTIDATVMISIPGSMTTVTLSGLIPFSTYAVRVLAVTMIGPGNFSESTTFSTSISDPGSIVNLSGVTNDATSALISWDAPPCPNAPITGYNIYYTMGSFVQNGTIDSTGYNVTQITGSAMMFSEIVTGLDPGASYVFHVRAFYQNSTNEISEGDAFEEALVLIEDQVVLPPSITAALNELVETDTNSLVIGLPSADAFADNDIEDIQYYGVIIVPDPDSDFDFGMDDFTSTYPNVQPYDNSGSNRYYITFAWNNVSEVPESFRIGDESTTTAIRSGQNESYFNAELERSTTHCMYVLIHYFPDDSNNLVIRYVDLGCVETDRGYSLIGLIIGVILAALLLCCLLLLCLILIICCCCKRRKDKDRSYSPEAAPAPRKQYSEPETVILNPYSAPLVEGNKTTVPIMRYPSYVVNMHSNQDFLFTEEYSHIEPDHNPTKNASNANKRKDRYLNIPAYDHSRVTLKHCPSGSNYINANYIAGYSKNGDFIATQGPMETTTEDFWCMVWEQDVATVVMLANLEENGKIKCHKYWPNSPHNSENVADFGAIRVEFLEETKREYQVVRTFYISMKGHSEMGRRVKQYHFIAWPDHGVPKKYDDFLKFMQQVMDNGSPSDGPTVVHCSAGVGRTGAFIAIYVQLIRAQKEHSVDIYSYVQYMRQQRPSMVLNETEYVFVHDALYEALKMGMVEGVEIDDMKNLQFAVKSKGGMEETDFSKEENILGSQQQNN